MEKTIAEHMVDILNEEGIDNIDIGQPWLWVECFERAGMESSKDIFRNGVRVMNALEKSIFFIKRYTYYKGKVRWFILKEEYRK